MFGTLEVLYALFEHSFCHDLVLSFDAIPSSAAASLRKAKVAVVCAAEFYLPLLSSTALPSVRLIVVNATNKPLKLTIQAAVATGVCKFASYRAYNITHCSFVYFRSHAPSFLSRLSPARECSSLLHANSLRMQVYAHRSYWCVCTYYNIYIVTVS